MADIYSNLRAALETHLTNISGIPDIAYESVAYEPTVGTSFVECKFRPTIRRPAVRGLNPQQRYQGVFSVTCYTPEGTGPAAADDLAKKVIDAFEATTDISYTNSDPETFILSIEYAEREQGFVDSPWYHVRVSIGWYIYHL
tara:strand:+ start:44 stop:469 length:426 start_codon:yes stop_codon:yes gene_type:complete